MLVLELARCEYVARRENIIAARATQGLSQRQDPYRQLGLGLAACQKGLSVGFAHGRVPWFMNSMGMARDEKSLNCGLPEPSWQSIKRLLIIDELEAIVPLSKTGAELLCRSLQPRAT